jgi:hypothetical protein
MFVQKSVVGVFNEVPGTGQDLAGQYVPMDDYLQQQLGPSTQVNHGLEQVIFGDQLPDQGSLDSGLNGLGDEQEHPDSLDMDRELLSKDQEQLDSEREILDGFKQYLNGFFEPNMP